MVREMRKQVLVLVQFNPTGIPDDQILKIKADLIELFQRSGQVDTLLLQVFLLYRLL